jgi:type IV pilus assembly protein PilC
VAVLVSIFAFPNILRLLTDLNIPLPMVTQVFLGLGEAMRRFGWLLLAIPLGFRLGLPYLLKRESIRLWWDTKILGLPLLGGLVIRMALSRFAHFLAEQYHAGIPLVQALRNSEAVTGNARLAFSIRTMASGVAQGTKLAVMAARLGYFPDLVVRMLAIGEETGKLEETLDRTAKHFDEEVTQGVNTAFMVLDPLIKVVMAGILVFVATAILLPLYSLMSGLNE